MSEQTIAFTTMFSQSNLAIDLFRDAFRAISDARKEGRISDDEATWRRDYLKRRYEVLMTSEEQAAAAQSMINRCRVQPQEVSHA